MKQKYLASRPYTDTPHSAWDDQTFSLLSFLTPEKFRCRIYCGPTVPCTSHSQMYLLVVISIIYSKMDYKPCRIVKKWKLARSSWPRIRHTNLPRSLGPSQDCPSLYLEESLPNSSHSSSLKPMHLFHDLKLMVWKQPYFILSSTDSHLQQPIYVPQSTHIPLILHFFCYVYTCSVSLPILPCKTTYFRRLLAVSSLPCKFLI